MKCHWRNETFIPSSVCWEHTWLVIKVVCLKKLNLNLSPLHCTDKEKCFGNQWLPVIFWNHLLWIYSGESLSAFCNPPFGLRSTWKKYYIHQLYTTAAKVKIFMRNTVRTDFSFTTCFLFVFVYVIPVLPSKFKQGFRGVCFCILTDTLGDFIMIPLM